MSESIRRRSRLNRADLLEVLAAKDSGALDYLVGTLGLEKITTQAKTKTKRKDKDKHLLDKVVQESLQKIFDKSRLENQVVKPTAGFWLLERREATVLETAQEDDAEFSTPVIWRERPDVAPVYYPLVSPRSLLPRLFHHLKYQRQGRAVDVDAVVRKMGRGEYLYHIPRASRRSLGRHLHIIEDRHLHLIPYWTDQGLFASLIASFLPDYVSSHDILLDGQRGDWFLPPPDSVVMAFSDLGALSEQPAAQVAVWLSIGQALQRLGCKLIAVIPCHPDECDPRLRELFVLEPWEPLRQLVKQSKEQRRQQANALLTLLAPAVRLEPGLLRSVRLAVLRNGYRFAAGVESAVWQHPDMLEASSIAATFNHEARARWLDAFAELEDDVVKQTVLDTIREWRAPLRQHVWFEEITSLGEDSRSLVSATDLLDANQYFQQLSQRYERDGLDLQADGATRSWFQRMEQRLPQDSWDLPEVGVALQRIAAQVHQYEGQFHAEHPIDPAKLMASQLPEKKVQLFQQGESVLVGSPQDTWLLVGSPIGIIKLCRGLLYLESLAGKGANVAETALSRQSFQFQLSADEVEIKPAPDVAGLMLRSDVETLYCKQISKPHWADSIGRDAEGLYVEHSCLGESYRSYWQNPEMQGATGHWQGFPPGDVWRDKYGVYAYFTIADIPYHFRWIKSGTFLMGSPESEPEREWAGQLKGSENQHQVTLSQGFWLADTTVTQAQWQAVMGNNTSNFKDDANNPVEQVSWNDAQAFIKKLNQQIPGLQAKLPTEAEWEYACRAGTTTPFSFGDHITPEQVNYNPYAGGKKGLYRQKTVPVKSLPANLWGLYEMHGNVREWCQDAWQEKLSVEPVTDPQGVAEGDQRAGVGRVIRGGSWDYGGGNVRSAFRGGDVPNYCYDNLGFRLALGHSEIRPVKLSAFDRSSILKTLRTSAFNCVRCTISKSRTQTVFGVGNVGAALMIIGEAPGAEEDRQGEPFVGAAGKLLDNLLSEIGMPRETVYISNVLKCRPPNNRDPRPDEITNCSSYLERQIELVDPAVILVLGRVAAQTLLQSDLPLTNLRAKEHRLPMTDAPVIVTYHPAYLLRQPADERKARQDFLLVRDLLNR